MFTRRNKSLPRWYPKIAHPKWWNTLTTAQQQIVTIWITEGRIKNPQTGAVLTNSLEQLVRTCNSNAELISYCTLLKFFVAVYGPSDTALTWGNKGIVIDWKKQGGLRANSSIKDYSE